ncbi:MAG: hypothetical protein JSW50_10265, partial [Candidatus Latescibacterota bacterium]
MTIGQSNLGVVIGFGTAIDASTPVHILTINYFNATGCLSCSDNHALSVVPDPTAASGQIEATTVGSGTIYPTGGTVYLCGSTGPPPSYNLEILNFTAPPTAKSGQDIAGMTALQIQNTGADNIISSFSVAYYLSTDPTFGPGDQVLARTIVPALASGESVPVTFSSAIPSWMPGSYYLGVFLDDGYVISETNESDNSAAQGFQLTQPLHNLTVATYTTPPEALPGDNITGLTTIEIANSEIDDVTTPFWVVLFLSVNDQKDGDDIWLEQILIPYVAGNSTVSVPFSNLTIPSQMAPGDYHLILSIDESAVVIETYELDNLAIADFTITAPPPPDLIIVSMTGPTSARQMEDISASTTLTIRNTGSSDINSQFYVRFFLSEDPVITEEDYRLSGPTILSLGAGETLDVPVENVKIGTNAPLGLQYLGAWVDHGSMISESNEDNNTFVAPDQILIIETPKTTVYYEDFQEGMAGWRPINFTSQDLHWHLTTYNDGVIDHGVWWCGEEGVESWADPDGYGNSWDQYLTKSFALPDTIPLSISYTIQYDTEPLYDFVYLEFANDGGTNFTPLKAYDGNSGGFISDSADLSAYRKQQVVLRFRFKSDGAWSDEDGLWHTDGALRVDEVQVTGYELDDFETGDDDWVASVAPQVGGDVAYRLEQFPMCSASKRCDDHDGFEVCNSWVAYDSVTLKFPTTPPADSTAGRPLNIGIESPVIGIPADGSAYFLRFDVYRDLPLEDGIFYFWEVAAPSDDHYQDYNFVYFGDQNDWIRSEFDITPFVPP